MLCRTHIKMKNRILYPFLLIIPKGKPIKQILSSFKISLKCRDKKETFLIVLGDSEKDIWIHFL